MFRVCKVNIIIITIILGMQMSSSRKHKWKMAC
uniref:Uncharacterized protein n=1 Tax=Rhizophora mucronata TaxID=61149 RepID=A0A2P2QJY3_RHIMU